MNKRRQDDICQEAPKKMRETVKPLGLSSAREETYELTIKNFYTLKEVKKLLHQQEQHFNAVLKEKEVEFNELLAERLHEQYSSFARFNQDCIENKLGKSEFSYVS